MPCAVESLNMHRDHTCVAVAFDEHRWPLRPSDLVTFTASDLSDLSRRTMRARRNEPDVVVFVDIHIAIADEAAVARGALSATGATVPAKTLVYIGTPLGLAGLIKDIHTLGLADGVFLRPLLTAQLELIRTCVLPVLRVEMPAFTAHLSCTVEPHMKENAR